MSEQTGQTQQTTTPVADATVKDLEKRARELRIEGYTKLDKEDLATAVADAEAALLAAPPPADPDQPTDGRPPLVEIAEDRAATTYVRVIDGGGKEQ